MSWKYKIKKITAPSSGIIAVDGTAYGQGKEAKIDFTGKYNAKEKTWDTFTTKTADPNSVASIPSKEIADVVEEKAAAVYELVYENEDEDE